MGSNGLPYSGSITYDPTYGYTSFDIKNVSLASGAQIVVGGILLFNENFGIELDANMLVAPSKFTANSTYLNTGSDLVEQKTVTYAKNAIWLTPSAYVKHDWDAVGVYARAGVAMPLGIKLVKESSAAYTTTSTTKVDNIYAEEQTSTKFGVGFSGAIGARINLAEYVHFWAEANFLSKSLTPTQSEYTKYDVNGVSYINSMPAPLKITNYDNSGAAPVVPANPVPFSTVGINIGISMDF